MIALPQRMAVVQVQVQVQVLVREPERAPGGREYDGQENILVENL